MWGLIKRPCTRDFQGNHQQERSFPTERAVSHGHSKGPESLIPCASSELEADASRPDSAPSAPNAGILFLEANRSKVLADLFEFPSFDLMSGQEGGHQSKSQQVTRFYFPCPCVPGSFFLVAPTSPSSFPCSIFLVAPKGGDFTL